MEIFVYGHVCLARKKGDEARWPLLRPTMSFGRSLASDCAILLPTVSKRHAEITVADEEPFAAALHVFGANGVQKDGRTHRAGTVLSLQEGDVFSICDRTFKWEAASHITVEVELDTPARPNGMTATPQGSPLIRSGKATMLDAEPSYTSPAKRGDELAVWDSAPAEPVAGPAGDLITWEEVEEETDEDDDKVVMGSPGLLSTPGLASLPRMLHAPMSVQQSARRLQDLMHRRRSLRMTIIPSEQIASFRRERAAEQQLTPFSARVAASTTAASDVLASPTPAPVILRSPVVSKTASPRSSTSRRISALLVPASPGSPAPLQQDEYEDDSSSSEDEEEDIPLAQQVALDRAAQVPLPASPLNSPTATPRIPKRRLSLREKVLIRNGIQAHSPSPPPEGEAEREPVYPVVVAAPESVEEAAQEDAEDWADEEEPVAQVEEEPTEYDVPLKEEYEVPLKGADDDEEMPQTAITPSTPETSMHSAAPEWEPMGLLTPMKDLTLPLPSSVQPTQQPSELVSTPVQSSRRKSGGRKSLGDMRPIFVSEMSSPVNQHRVMATPRSVLRPSTTKAVTSARRSPPTTATRTSPRENGTSSIAKAARRKTVVFDEEIKVQEIQDIRDKSLHWNPRMDRDPNSSPAKKSIKVLQQQAATSAYGTRRSSFQPQEEAAAPAATGESAMGPPLHSLFKSPSRVPTNNPSATVRQVMQAGQPLPSPRRATPAAAPHSARKVADASTDSPTPAPGMGMSASRTLVGLSFAAKRPDMLNATPIKSGQSHLTPSKTTASLASLRERISHLTPSRSLMDFAANDSPSSFDLPRSTSHQSMVAKPATPAPAAPQVEAPAPAPANETARKVAPPTPAFGGIRNLFSAPAAAPATPSFNGMKSLLNEPAAQPATPAFGGIRGLFTARPAPPTPAYAGVRELLQSAPVAQTPAFSGMRLMLQEQRRTQTPHYDGMRSLMATPVAVEAPVALVEEAAPVEDAHVVVVSEMEDVEMADAAVEDETSVAEDIVQEPVEAATAPAEIVAELPLAAEAEVQEEESSMAPVEEQELVEDKVAEAIEEVVPAAAPEVVHEAETVNTAEAEEHEEEAREPEEAVEIEQIEVSVAPVEMEEPAAQVEDVVETKRSIPRRAPAKKAVEVETEVEAPKTAPRRRGKAAATPEESETKPKRAPRTATKAAKEVEPEDENEVAEEPVTTGRKSRIPATRKATPKETAAGEPPKATSSRSRKAKAVAETAPETAASTSPKKGSSQRGGLSTRRQPSTEDDEGPDDSMVKVATKSRATKAKAPAVVEAKENSEPAPKRTAAKKAAEKLAEVAAPSAIPTRSLRSRR